MPIRDFRLFKYFFYSLLIPFLIALAFYVIGYFFPLGFIIAGFAAFIIFCNGGVFLFFGKEMIVIYNNKITVNDSKDYKKFLRIASIPFFFLGIILIPFGGEKLNEMMIGSLLFGLGIITMGIFLLAASFRTYENNPNGTSH